MEFCGSRALAAMGSDSAWWGSCGLPADWVRTADGQNWATAPVARLRDAEKLQAQGATIPQVCKKLGGSELTFSR